MAFYSILYREKNEHERDETLSYEQPACFKDLNLDQIIETITIGKEEYDLKPFFYSHLCCINEILYRQEIMRDLENPSLFDAIRLFAGQMIEMRKFLSGMENIQYLYQKERFFLDAVLNYCKAVDSLAKHLWQLDLKSSGFMAFREYLTSYSRSDRFTALHTEAVELIEELSAIQYCVHFKKLRISVLPFHAKADYSKEIEQLFSKFRQDAVKDYKKDFPFSLAMNRVEAMILDGVAKLYPDLFKHLDLFCQNKNNFRDEMLIVFDREVQFYVAYLEYIVKLKKAGLSYCYPGIIDNCKEVYDYEGFDLALANKLIIEKKPVICNGFHLKNEERVIVVTGPNQGGKTTFARTFGQLHYLACLGLPVAGSKAQLFLYDNLFTHFEKEENITTHHSKFEDDLLRIHSSISRATTDSIFIMNEVLSSTSSFDGTNLSHKIMEKIIELDAICLWVTFIYELGSLSKKTISMVGTVNPMNPTIRTFRIVRRSADGLAYALSIAEKHAVTYRQLKKRLE